MKIVSPPKLSDELQITSIKTEAKAKYAPYYEDGFQTGFPSPADDFKDT
ncbi:MAG: hypothetical protein ACK5JS_05260 [Mangrovibacterium sp.]